MQPRLILPSQEYLEECFVYDKDTGKLFWRQRPTHHFTADRWARSWNAAFAGSRAFTSINTPGYYHGSLNKKMYIAQRIIWKLVTGQEPPAMVDHKNRNRLDNRWDNLRPASFSENEINRTKTHGASRVIGVRVTKRGNWEARIHKDKRYFHLGTFASKADAVAARNQAAQELYGEFAP